MTNKDLPNRILQNYGFHDNGLAGPAKEHLRDKGDVALFGSFAKIGGSD